MIGYTLKDDSVSKIEVVDFVGYDKNRKNKYYKVVCSLCSKDTELFYKDFIMSKSNIKKGKLPCGCSLCPSWDEIQTKVLVKRKSFGRFSVGEYGKYQGQKTKVNMKCDCCGYEWRPTIASVITGKGCDKCARAQSSIDRKNKKAEDGLIDYLTNNGYNFVGWENGKYENTFSEFKFLCPIHGEKCCTYNNIMNHKRGCPDCNEKGGGFDRSSDISYLYLVEWHNDVGDSWIKFGITDDVQRRMDQIKKENMRKNGRVLENKVLHVFIGTGYTISKTESYIKSHIGKSHIPKTEMYSGFTECTNIENLPKIISLISENNLAQHNQN